MNQSYLVDQVQAVAVEEEGGEESPEQEHIKLEKNTDKFTHLDLSLLSSAWPRAKSARLFSSTM